MKFTGLLSGAAILTAIAAAPAMAATSVDTTACAGFSISSSCRFNGNINSSNSGNNSYLHAQSAYNALFNPDITLNVLASTDDGNFGDFGSFTGAGSSSGTWTLTGYDIDYVAVKAGNFFILHAVSGSTGSWSTAGIQVGNSPNNPELSHLVFFGSVAGAVPEPGTWALMILGFGMAGAAMRQQRKARVRFA